MGYLWDLKPICVGAHACKFQERGSPYAETCTLKGVCEQNANFLFLTT